MKKLNNKGFSLIELLGVVVIMGILMLIAIPSIRNTTDQSRKEVYLQMTKTYRDKLIEKMSAKEYVFKDPTATYYVHINNLETQNKSKSPYGDWIAAYVIVTYDADTKSYKYYWTSADVTKRKIAVGKEINDLKKSDIFFDDSTYTIVYSLKAIGSRTHMIVYDETGERHDSYVDSNYIASTDMTIAEAARCYSYQILSENPPEIKLTWYNNDGTKCPKDVVIPAYIDGYKMVEINQYTFNNMGITSVQIPPTVRTIGGRAFYNNRLTDVNIPGSVKTLGGEVFAYNQLSNHTLNEGLQTIGNECFKNNSLSSYNIPSSVQTIGSCAYCNNPIPNAEFLYAKDGSGKQSIVRGYIGNLDEFRANKKFIVPERGPDGTPITEISSSAFQRMSLSGWEVVLPSTIKKIGSSAFWATGISKVNLPEGLEYVGSSAFRSNNITSLVLPSTLKTIGDIAFNANKTTNIDEVWIYNRNATTGAIDYSTLIGFSGANRSNQVIPGESHGVALKTIKGSSLNHSGLNGTIKIPSSVTKISSTFLTGDNINNIDNGDGVFAGPYLYGRTASGAIDKTNLLAYTWQSQSNVVVPSTVKKIGSNAFCYTYTKSVTLPEGLTTIGSSAFYYCHLSTITIPSTVTSIGSSALDKQVTWAKMNENLTTIVNKTGRSFNWKSITSGPSPATFVTGTVENWYGDIQVVSG